MSRNSSSTLADASVALMQASELAVTARTHSPGRSCSSSGPVRSWRRQTKAPRHSEIPSSPLPDPMRRSETFQEACCRELGYTPDEFGRRVFWRALYPHARPVALVAGFRSDYFALDRALIAYCGQLDSLRQIDAELPEFAQRSSHGFMRGICRIRVSAGRLRKLAKQCLDSKASLP